MKQLLTKADYKRLTAMERAWLLVECHKLGKKTEADDNNVIVLPFLTIGELFEVLERNNFFGEDSEYQYHVHIDYDGWHVRAGADDQVEVCYSDKELINALFNAVKAVCGKEN